MKLLEIEKRLKFFIEFSKKSMKGKTVNEWIVFLEELGTYQAECSEIVMNCRENYENAKEDGNKAELFLLKQMFKKSEDIQSMITARKSTMVSIISAEKELIKNRI